MAWTAQLVETRTGNVLADLHLLEGSSWQDGPLNSAGHTVSIVPYEAARLLPAWALTPYAAAVVPCWDGAPIMWSPLTATPKQEVAGGPVTLTGGSMWDLLRWRLVTERDFGPADVAPLAHSVTQWTGLSLGSIGWRILERIQWRQGGGLPIRHGSPDETAADDADHQRTYDGFDVANIDAASRLQNITSVINGPDMRFRPERLGDRRVGLVYEHGTEAQPEIAQPQPWVLDLTVTRPDAAGVRLSSQWQPVSRIYGTGAGQDAGTLLAAADLGHIPADGHLPWLEDVWSDSSIEDLPLLVTHTSAELAGRQTATVQAATSIPADSDVLPMGRVTIGDRVLVRWPDGWLELPAGEHLMTVLQLGAAYGGTVEIEFQAMGVAR